MDARTRRAGVSMRPEVVAEFADRWPSGIAAARDGRLFLSFPRVDAIPAPATLAELIDGKAVPYPDELVNAIDTTDPGHRFVSAAATSPATGSSATVKGASISPTWRTARCSGGYPRSDRIAYITDSQVNRMPIYHDGENLRTPPYRLYPAAIDADPAQF